jgi:hypothetical protein
MFFSENRFPLFRIMLKKIKAARDRRPGGLADVVPTQTREVGSLPPRRVGYSGEFVTNKLKL